MIPYTSLSSIKVEFPGTQPWLRTLRNTFLVWACIWPSLLFGGAIEVHPVAVHLSNNARIASVFVQNNDNQATVLQLSLSKWEQKNGKDLYTEQKKLIVTPPIVTLAAHQGQVIRIGMMEGKNHRKEEAYRLYLQEIPEQRKTQKHAGFVLALRISLPVFISPAQPEPPKLLWTIDQRTQDPKSPTWELRVTNQGNVHARITELALANAKNKHTLIHQKTLTYILPGQSHTWRLASLKNAQKLVHPLIQATTNWGNLVAQPHKATHIVQKTQKTAAT